MNLADARSSAILALLLPSILAIGCSPAVPISEPVSRIFVGTACQYTVLIEDSEMITAKTFYHNAPKIYHDVSVADSLWIKYTPKSASGVPCLIEIHVRGIFDLEPGGWNNGKAGQGHNVELE